MKAGLYNSCDLLTAASVQSGNIHWWHVSEWIHLCQDSSIYNSDIEFHLSRSLKSLWYSFKGKILPSKFVSVFSNFGTLIRSNFLFPLLRPPTEEDGEPLLFAWEWEKDKERNGGISRRERWDQVTGSHNPSLSPGTLPEPQLQEHSVTVHWPSSRKKLKNKTHKMSSLSRDRQKTHIHVEKMLFLDTEWSALLRSVTRALFLLG